jgi:hypothetical protein
VVSLASAGGAHGLIAGWDIAALVSAGLCALGVAIIASCRTWRCRTRGNEPRAVITPDLA